MNPTPAARLQAPHSKPVYLVGERGPELVGRPPAARLQAPERKDGGPELKHLSIDCELKFDDQSGEFEGYCSKFDLLDRGGDIVKPGAFKASLADWKRRKQSVPVLWQHNPSNLIGSWTELKEDDVGLFGRGQLVMEVPQAAAARALLKAKALTGLSIGYATKDYEIDRQTGARLLKKVDLWEVSLVTFPMLPEALVTGAKTIDLDPRALEQLLRSELNLSAAAAVKAVAIVKRHLREGGDSEPMDAARDGLKDVLMSLRKSAEALR